MFQWLKDFFVDNSRNTFKEEKDNDFEGYGYMKRVYGIDNMPRFETIAKLTRTDPLTKAYNRIAFEDSLQHEIYISQRYKTDFSIVLIKIKDFTTINNEYGTLVGDQVLKETFIKIKESLRASDTIFRWGGVEFLAMLTHTDLSGAEVTAKHIQEKIKKSEFEYIDHLEVIVGVTQYKENDSSVTLVKRVEDGRKRAKEDPLGVVVLP